MMLPSREQIERAAYERWERRGRFHGADRADWVAAEMDTVFDLNYQVVAEFWLAEPDKRVIGDARRPRCRFCEQSPPRAAFSFARPAIPELVGNTSLFTRELCDECAKQFADTIDAEFARFWESLEALRAGTASFREIRAPTAIPIAAYKSLIRMALSLMPEQELSSFADTIEWVSNPDHAFDRSLFDNAGCLVYQAHVPFRAAWVCLSCRTEKDAPFPYMLFFLGAERLILQVHLPLCALDEDLDGTEVHMPQRSFSTGTGPDLQTSTCLALPLKSAADPSRTRRFRLFL
ncbi:MAG: DUF2934 domain-containing protein [Isosphaeraceae bacterium]|jgi:hypothetical protein